MLSVGSSGLGLHIVPDDTTNYLTIRKNGLDPSILNVKSDDFPILSFEFHLSSEWLSEISLHFNMSNMFPLADPLNQQQSKALMWF